MKNTGTLKVTTPTDREIIPPERIVRTESFEFGSQRTWVGGHSRVDRQVIRKCTSVLADNGKLAILMGDATLRGQYLWV